MARESLVVQTMVQLADSLVDDFDVVDLLTHLSDSCIDVLDVAAAGLMLVSPRGELRVVASSSEQMRVVELFELQHEEGPCVDCIRTATRVNERLNGSLDRWPRFTPVGLDAGYRAVHAVPMRLRSELIGALNMFRTEPELMSANDLAVAQALADIATIAIVHHRALADAQRLNDQLTRALQSRVVIEQAKGVLAEATGVEMDVAFTRLRRHARNHNLLLADVAAAVAGKTLAVPDVDDL